MEKITKRKNFFKLISILISCFMLVEFLLFALPEKMYAKNITVYSQTDSRWANASYGLGPNGEKATISSAGCGILSYVNAVYYMTDNFIQPIELANWSVNNGYRINGEGTSHALYKAFADKHGSSYGFKYAGSATNVTQINSHLLNGGTAIISVPGHLMALVDYEQTSKKYLILDSYKSSNRGTYTNGYRWLTASEFTGKLKISAIMLLSPVKSGGGNNSDIQQASSYRTPCKSYAISTSNISVYDTIGGNPTSGRYITGSTDLCTIEEIYTNGWCKVTYPVSSGGMRTAYTPLSEFIQNASPTEWIATGDFKAYRRSTGTETIGSVSKGDACVKVAEANGRTQVMYPVSGQNYYKMGWIETPSQQEVRPGIRRWLSDTAMGEKVSTFAQGKQYYLCYELKDANTGKLLSEIGNYSYSVKQTLLYPDGTVGTECTYNNDNNWIAIRCTVPGTYSYKIEITGDWNGTFNGTFEVKEVAAGIKKWLSDTAMGEKVSTFAQGKQYYLCYELKDANTGKLLSEIENYSYSVKETLLYPDGTVGTECTYNNDNNWIAIKCTVPGTYSYKIEITGDWNGTFNGTFEVEKNPIVVGRPSDNVTNPTLGSLGITGTIQKPDAVSGLKIGGRATDALRLNWNKNSNASGYIIEQYKEGKWTRIAKIENNSTTTYRVEKLSSSTTYQFRVQSYSFDGSTPLYSSWQSINGKTLPTTVSGLKIGGRATDALRLNWNKNSNASGYIIEQYKNGKWTRIAKIENNSTTTYRVEKLSNSTTYKFRVQSYSFDGSTPLYSSWQSINGKTLPTIVSGLKIGGRATDALRLNWNKNSNVSGYIIEQYKNGKWTRIAKIENNSTTTYRVEKLGSSTTYKFRVQSYSFDGSTPLYSSWQSINGKTLPKTVSGLKIGGRAIDALRLNWDKNSNASGYIIEQYKNGKWTRIARIGSNSTTTYRVEKLSASTTYKFRVQSFGFDGNTPLYSSWQYVNGTTK